MIVSRSASELETVRQDILAINKEIEVLAVPTDARNPDSVGNLWEKVKATFGKADVLINNTGTLMNGLVSHTLVDTWWTDFVSIAREVFWLD